MTPRSGRDINASDWTERDLLTRELATQRLTDDEAATKAELTALLARDEADADAIAHLERRLKALEATRRNLQSNSAGAIESRRSARRFQSVDAQANTTVGET